jgi:hypothetical protein
VPLVVLLVKLVPPALVSIQLSHWLPCLAVERGAWHVDLVCGCVSVWF